MKLTMSGGGTAAIAGDHVFGSRVDVYVGVLHWLSKDSTRLAGTRPDRSTAIRVSGVFRRGPASSGWASCAVPGRPRGGLGAC